MNRRKRANLKSSGGPRRAGLEAPSLDTFRKGLEAARGGNHSAAIVLYRQTIAQQPNHCGAHTFLGLSLRERGELVPAIAHYEKALDLQPHNAETRLHLAETQRRFGMLPAAIENCTKVIAQKVDVAPAHLVRALARKDLGDREGALSDLRQTIRLESKSLVALKLLGGMLLDAGQMAEALVHLDVAAAVDTTDFETFRLIGGCRQSLGDIKGTIDAYQKAITLNPKHALTYVYLSGVLTMAGEMNAALTAASIAVRLEPNMPSAYYNLATAFNMSDRPQEAIEAYALALRCDPQFGLARFSMCMLLRQDCRWDDIDALENLAQDQTYRKGIPVTPFNQLPMTGSLTSLYECNRVYADHIARLKTTTLTRYEPRPLEQRKAKIRIGYLSADFRDHATAALLVQVLETHDKSRFETFGYSIGRADNHILMQRIHHALDHFIDLNHLSHVEAARRIHQDRLDILLDLKGYTFQSRPEILIDRPAPIQVNYLGYPTTMGASFIDYIVADAVVAPEGHQPFYTEQIVHLPNCYQPNDRKRIIGDFIPSRAMCGLPDDGFVFCCFNGNYKLNSQMFDIWMRLLDAAPGSVLWLLASNSRTPDNLRREALSRGVDPSRLVFAPKLPGEDHLARMTLGDLFLDTMPVGAHTTASEALWTGVPVLTFLGESFPARVGASLLTAIGMPELIAQTLAEYETIALRLARTPADIVALKTKLRQARATAPLFDAVRYTRNLEAALARMIELRDLGQEPIPFAIEEPEGIEPTSWSERA